MYSGPFWIKIQLILTSSLRFLLFSFSPTHHKPPPQKKGEIIHNKTIYNKQELQKHSVQVLRFSSRHSGCRRMALIRWRAAQSQWAAAGIRGWSPQPFVASQGASYSCPSFMCSTDSLDIRWSYPHSPCSPPGRMSHSEEWKTCAFRCTVFLHSYGDSWACCYSWASRDSRSR